jgi:FKBP-type peptidyl-prolyl cis-trans isomerase SlyD
MKITKNTVAQFHYKLTNSQGDLLDTSEGREPLLYLHGNAALISGLETQLEDKTKGDKFTANIASADAYGDYNENLVHIVPKSGFQNDGDEQLSEGMQVQVDTNNGMAVALVTKIEGEDVTLDLNHPLAGMDLIFDIEVMDVRMASKEEMEHGHAHGVGGHQH